MSKFQKLAAINKIANECIQDGDYVLASKFHNEFMKVAQLDFGQPEFQFIAALVQAPNFSKIISQAPKMEGRMDIPTFRPDSSSATVALVQELIGLPADGKVGPKTLNALKYLLDSGKLDSELTSNFKRKFKIS